MTRRTLTLLAGVLAGAVVSHNALGFGPAGHRIVGTLAEPLLCEATAARIAALTGGDGLAEIGLWADRIRGDDDWRHTGPWHYMNIEDGASIASFAHPPEGDVLWAIEHHAERLADRGAGRAERRIALHFFVHFVADVHQPLHVGRADDRGGNTIEVRAAGAEVTLHRFWDTEALGLAGIGERALAATLEPVVHALAAGGTADERAAVWAAESLALRPYVYSFEADGRGAAELDARYVEQARLVVRVRLAQAAVRLAGRLDTLLAGGEC